MICKSLCVPLLPLLLVFGFSSCKKETNQVLTCETSLDVPCNESGQLPTSIYGKWTLLSNSGAFGNPALNESFECGEVTWIIRENPPTVTVEYQAGVDFKNRRLEEGTWDFELLAIGSCGLEDPDLGIKVNGIFHGSVIKRFDENLLVFSESCYDGYDMFFYLVE